MQKFTNYLSKLFTKQNIIYGLASYSVYKLAVSPLLRSLSFFYKHCLRPRKNLLQRYGRGSWAVITGSTSGIGEQFAYQLASLGFNIILVGRSLEKLNTVLQTIQAKYPEVQAKIYQLDLSSTNVDDYKQLAESLQGLDLSILINNAGLANFGKLGQTDVKQIESMINTNMGHYCYLTHYLMPKLKNRGKKSALVFVSSSGADVPLPFMATYAATKQFNNHFAQCLSYEVYQDGIDVLSLKPMQVQSGIIKKEPSGMSVISAQECVSKTLDKLGYDIETRGSWKHQITFSNFKSFLTILPCNILLRKMTAMSRRMWYEMQKKKQEQAQH